MNHKKHLLSLHIDCQAGAAGDMFLAAFAGLGVTFAPLEQLFSLAGIPLSICIAAENRAAGMGRQVTIKTPHQQPLRYLQHIIPILKKLNCSAWVTEQSIQAFTTLAKAEAHVHGCPIESVHFHEVGAIDTLADIVGTFWSIEQLGISSVTCTPLPWFTGSVQCEHGLIPLPAPATLELMQGLPISPSNFTEEVITPTGALLLKMLTHHLTKQTNSLSLPQQEANSPNLPQKEANQTSQVNNNSEGSSSPQQQAFSRPPTGKQTAFTSPSGICMATATGYGQRKAPQGLRLSLFAHEAPAKNAWQTDTITMLETHIDHLTGEELGLALEALMQENALDVLWLPGTGKKNRPAGCLRVLCQQSQQEHLAATLFKHTHTLGVRHSQLERYLLPRAYNTETQPHTKEYELENCTYQRIESDSIQTLAQQQNIGAPALRLGKKQ